WWNANANTCYLKKTDQSKPDFYTWFVGSQGAIPGDIPQFDISDAPAFSPQECYNRCRTTAGGQWVNYHDLGYGQGVHCWLKKANGLVGATTGVASSAATVQNACTGEGDYISVPGIDIGTPGFDLQRIDLVVSPCECAQYCEANDACDFFNQGSNTCWLKQTAKKPGFYTWFLHANGPIAGDIPNFDLPGTTPTFQHSAIDCYNLCSNTANCNWVNYNLNADGTVAQCWLKQATPAGNRVTGFTRGGGFGVVNNVDISGFDLAGPINVPSPKACARLCAGNGGCGWSNFVQGTGCYLKVPQGVGNAFTWFLGSSAPFQGDIPNFDLQGPFTDPSGNACLTRCTQTPNCQWVNYLVNGNGVQCWLKTGTPFNGKSIVFNFASPLSSNAQQAPPPVPAIGGQFAIPNVCDRSGQNKQSQFCSGAVGIHAVLTSGGAAGKVLFFERPHSSGNPFTPIVNPLTVVGGSNHPYGEVVSVYDLATNTFTPISVNDNPFCAGHTLLPNGHVLIAGGDDPKDGPGHPNFHINDGRQLLRDFDPFSNKWTVLGQMTSARWYLTLVHLPDDRIMIWGGITDDDAGGQAVNNFEVFNITSKTSGQQTFSPLLAATAGPNVGKWNQQNLYPFIKVLPDGNLFLFASQSAKFFNTRTMTEFGNLPNTPGNFLHNYPQSGA
ncbi:hypothetical protein HDU76_007333, partial [Blyttiomyces sp. JEL0837]